jgi:putative transposase
MPWNHSSCPQLREDFLRAVRRKLESFTEACARFGISRKTGYKWRQRQAEEGRRGLQDQSRRPREPAQAQALRWRAEVLALRKKHAAWGAKKLRVLLVRRHPRASWPSVRSLERWLREAQLTQPRRAAVRGPAVPHPGLTVAQRANEVWTVDFKGWYRTTDGERQEPLTVRDLATRYLLAIRLLPHQSEDAVRAVFQRLFRRFGLPQALRSDNGSPFGSKGALGLTRLSVWWQRLGIRVEFMRRARPGDNAGHEQMHGLFAREVAASPAPRRALEQRRVERWRKEYNEVRPHEALHQQSPARQYQASRRRLPGRLPALRYRCGWLVRRVRPHGDIKWEGRLRFIGRAFAGELIGLCAVAPGHWDVYLGELLIGTLWREKAVSMHPAHWDRTARTSTPAKRAPKG